MTPSSHGVERQDELVYVGRKPLARSGGRSAMGGQADAEREAADRSATLPSDAPTENDQLRSIVISLHIRRSRCSQAPSATGSMRRRGCLKRT